MEQISEEWRDLISWADALQSLNEREEKEETPYLSDAEKSVLSQCKHVFDYKFSDGELKFLNDNGYLVIKGLISRDICKDMVNELFEKAEKLDGLSQFDHKTWRDPSGFFDIWHSKLYYQIRQHPQLYSIFAQLLKEPHLTVSLDRVSIKPPGFIYLDEDDNIIENPSPEQKVRKYQFPQQDFAVHNDMNLWNLQETNYQGGLSLNDCPIGGGGFRCIPGFHKLAKIREYREKYQHGDLPHLGGPQMPPYGSFLYFQDFAMIKKEVKEIPMEAGDFIIWSSRLPHSNCINLSNQWRMQCFVRFVPDNEKYKEYRKDVYQSMLIGEKPNYYSTGLTSTGPGNVKWEEPMHIKPELSWLGQRVLGEVDWVEEETL